MKRKFTADRLPGVVFGLLVVWLSVATVAGAKAAPASYLEHELELARGGGVYLVLRPASGESRPTLEIRARGMVLETITLQRLAILRHRPLLAGSAAPASSEVPPGAWEVSATDLEYRRVIAPRELRPLGVESSPSPSPAGGDEAELPLPPDSYSVELRPHGIGGGESAGTATGWRLVVGREIPHSRVGERIMGVLEAGWGRLRGHRAAPPSLLALAAPAPQARRLHHLLRPGVVVLLDARPHAESRR